ncbi:hypothetical protein HX744_31620 [Pseudonocardia sp. ICBG1122]|nr:hypothetical protein [Pseudonocardia pini]
MAPDIAVLFGYRSLGVTASVGQPLARTLAIGAASVAVAGLLAAVVHAPGTARGALSPTGYAALQVVRPAGLIFAASAIAVALLTIAESIGIGPGRLLQNPPALVQALLTIDAAAGWVIAALMVGTAGLAAGTVLTWRGATGVFVVLLAGLIVPPPPRRRTLSVRTTGTETPSPCTRSPPHSGSGARWRSGGSVVGARSVSTQCDVTIALPLPAESSW